MARQSFIQINGVLYDKSLPLPDGVGEPAKSYTVMGDLPDFVSPIDGSVVRGRAGLREHCKRHDVVPTADLQGLPPKPAIQQYTPDRAAIREQLKKQYYR